MKKILITGVAGFIGYHLAERLLKDSDIEIVGIDNINDYYNVELKYARLALLGIAASGIRYNEPAESVDNGQFKFIKLDITDREAVAALFGTEHFDVVAHLAAQAGVRYSIENPQAYISTNIDGFFNIMENSKHCGVRHFVYASSSSVYGLNMDIPFRETAKADTPVSLYGATKKADELMCHAYSALYGLHTTGVRFFTAYGAYGRPDMAPMKFMKAIDGNLPIKIYNHGNLYRDFTYIDDIVEALSRIIPRPSQAKIPYCIYNIGHSSPVLLTDFVDAMERVMDKKAIREYVDMQPGDVYRTYADVDRLSEDFHFHPSIELETGLERLYKWYREGGYRF